MRTYRITLTGKTPLLMHYDDVRWADKMAAWLTVPENKPAPVRPVPVEIKA